jgi:hypothetical protein
MMECRQCRELIRGDAEAIGSRCPRCRMPLYERTQLPRRLNPGEAGRSCAVHPGIQALGPCQRCGAFMCFTCRTRWYEQAVCPACVERALTSNEPAPENLAAHRRQAMLSMVFAVGGWVLFILGGLPLMALQGSRPNHQLTVLGMLVVLASFIPAVFGVGQATAAIRARGQRTRLATSGLIFAGTHLGIMIGFLLLNIWHN